MDNVVEPNKKFVEITTGKDLPSIVKRMASVSPSHSIAELVANGYDADATHIELFYKPLEDILEYHDNGTGIPNLEDFFRSGDSIKKESRETPSGRRTHGSFGIATVLLAELAERYTLITTHGDQTSIAEVTTGSMNVGDRIYYQTESAGNRSPGTQIILEGLKFTASDLNIGSLKSRLQWEFPLHKPDFDVSVDGKVINAKSLESATQFEVKGTGNSIGKVSGILYLANRSAKKSGIHVYVNDRVIGDPQRIAAQVVTKSGVAAKLTGIIYADGLDPVIGVDRGSFRENSKEYRELIRILKKSGTDVRKHYEDRLAQGKVDKAAANVKAAVKAVEQKVRRSEIPEMSNGTSVMLTEGFRPDQIGTFDQDECVIYINQNHPHLWLPKAQKPEIVTALEGAIVETLTLHRVNNSGSGMDSYNRHRYDITRMLKPDYVELAEGKEINPRILYSVREARELIGDMSLAEINYVIAGGLIPCHDDRISGSRLIEYLRETKGMIPLHSFALEHFENVPSKMESIERVLSEVGEEISPVITNLGRNSTKCYFVDESCAQMVAETMQSMPIKSKAYANRVSIDVGVERIPQMLDGVNIKTTSDVLTYMKSNGLPDRNDANGKVNIVDFVFGLQAYRSSMS